MHVMNNTFDPSDLALMLELGHGLKRNQFDRALIKKLSEGDLLSQVRLLLTGEAKVEIVKHIINLDSDPFVTNGWTVQEHTKGGQFEWNPAKVKFYLSESQARGNSIDGNKLRKEHKSLPVFNANLLDHLLRNPNFIPEEWKGKVVCFWGTIYRNSVGSLCVRGLYWDGFEWRWDYGWLGSDFNSVSPAAILAK